MSELHATVDLAVRDTHSWQFELAKNIAPTRPHPSAPDKPPDKILAPGAVLIDRIRDALSGHDS